MNLYDRMREKFKLAADAPVGVAFGPMAEFRIKAAERDQPAMLTAVATTPRVDLDGEVVVADGLDPSTFRRLGSVYYNHDYDTVPVAALRNVVALKGGAGWRVQMAIVNTPFAQDVATAVEAGAIRGTSIGFRRLDWGEPTDMEVRTYGPHNTITRKADWIELSITPMPCNPDAMIDGARSMLVGDEADAIDRLAVKGRISRDSAYKMGLPKPRTILQVKRVLSLT